DFRSRLVVGHVWSPSRYAGQATGASASRQWFDSGQSPPSSPVYLHLAKWPFALRHVLGFAGLVGHFMNLPLASLQGAASDGAEPANRLSAVNAKTNFFMLSSLGTGKGEHRPMVRPCASQ